MRDARVRCGRGDAISGCGQRDAISEGSGPRLSNLLLVAKHRFELILELGLVLLHLRDISSCCWHKIIVVPCAIGFEISARCRSVPFRVWFRPLNGR